MIKKCQYQLWVCMRKTYKNIFQVLERVVADWPEPVSPQILRTRLTEYKQSLSNENLQKGVCACCACLTPKPELERVDIYAPTADRAPPWMNWDADKWQKFGAAWFEKLNDLLSTDSYLDRYFEAKEKISGYRASGEERFWTTTAL